VVAEVSVCIPAYQAGRFIRSTLESVLAQTLTDFEVVVLDNGSTDDTAAIVAGFGDPRIRLEHNDAVLPLPANWNRVVSLSRSPLVKVLCADDVIYPHCLQSQAAALAAAPSAALVACRRDLVDGDGATIYSGGGLRWLLGPRTRTEVIRAIVRHGGNPIGNPSSVLFRRDAFEAAGGFDEDKLELLDIDMWIRLLDHGGLVGQAESLAAFRVHGASTTQRIAVEQQAVQAAMIRELATGGVYRVRAFDRLVGAAVTPVGRFRWNRHQSRGYGSAPARRLPASERAGQRTTDSRPSAMNGTGASD
jgi:glycosyltransferase involved in cell wall biosynthesis